MLVKLGDSRFHFYQVKADDTLDEQKARIDDSDPGYEYTKLSYGHQKAVSLIMWLYHVTRGAGENIKLILLDEPDAHFNPALIRMFYEIVSQALAQNGRRVIVTTHRVDTLALADENVIYTIQREQGQATIGRAKSVRDAITTLSDGLLTVTTDTHYLTVEDQDDAEFYSIIRDKLEAVGSLPTNRTNSTCGNYPGQR